MIKQVTLEHSTEITELAPHVWAIELLVSEHDAPNLCLALLLLDYDLVDAVSITSQRKYAKMLSIATRPSTVYSVINSSPSEKTVRIGLARNAIQALIAFILRFHRDGFTPVSHIDIELHAPEGSPLDCTLVMRSEKWAPPLSSKEARRLLGME